MFPMKAYKIDATNNVITTIEMSEDYREISRNIDCDCFTVGRTLKNGDTLFVDDEGFLNSNVKRGFMFDGQFFAGNGVFLGGTPDGSSADVKTNELDIASRVTFAPSWFQITDEMREEAMSSWKITPF